MNVLGLADDCASVAGPAATGPAYSEGDAAYRMEVHYADDRRNCARSNALAA